MNIEVTSLERLGEELTDDVASVVSICDVGTDPDPEVEFGDRFVLELRFDDHESDKWDHAPTVEDVQKIVDAFEELEKQKGTTLIHCHGGTCRSTATAFVLKAMELGPGKEKEAAEWVMETFPWAIPNLLICKIADDLLERGGALFDAIFSFDPEMDRRALEGKRIDDFK